jgi:hypothetical protein
MNDEYKAFKAYEDRAPNGGTLEAFYAGAEWQAARAASPVQQPTKLTDSDVKAMVDRFLGWKLPKDFCPDAGISFKPTKPYEGDEYGNSWWPVGTNLLTAEQAKAMFVHALGPLVEPGAAQPPTPQPPQGAHQGWRPIETAPTGGRPVLVWDGSPNGGCAVSHLLKYPGRPDSWINPGCHKLHPTHWMPLPAPPSQEGETR